MAPSLDLWQKTLIPWGLHQSDGANPMAEGLHSSLQGKKKVR